MGLQEQHVAFKFAGGVETKMDSKAVPPVRLLALRNGVFSRAISIKKRNGYERLAAVIDGDTAMITGGRRLGSRDDELLLFTQNRCYSKQSGADQWTDSGALVAPIGSDRAVVHTGTAQTTPDHATNNGVTVYAWEDSLGGVWWTAVDATSQSIHRAPTQANASGERPRVVAVGEAIIVFYAVPSQHAINAIVVNTSTPTAAVSEVLVIEDCDSTHGCYDAVPTAREGTPALIAWHEHATTNLRVAYVTAAGVLGSPASGHPSAAQAAVGLLTPSGSPVAVAFQYVDGADGDIIEIAYVRADGTGAVAFLSGGESPTAIGATTSTEVIVFGATDARRAALVVADSVTWVVFEESAAEPSDHRCQVNSITDGVAGTARTIRSLCLASRAFQAGADEDAFAVFVHDTTYFNTYETLRLSDFAPTGRHLPGSACGPEQRHLPAVYVSDDVVSVALPYKTRLESANNDKFTESAVRLVTMDFDSEDSHQTAQFGRGLYLAAACPQHYAGRKWVEQGFHMGPEHIVNTVNGSGGSQTAGTRVYRAWYEWTDDLGEIHRGPTSPGTTVVLTTETQVTLTIPTLRVTRKDNVRICVARSRAGDASELFRVSSLDPTTEGDPNGYLANDPTVDSVTFIDRFSDTTLENEEPLYTTNGILSNDSVPLGSHVAVGKNRLFFTDAQDGHVVRFSKRIAAGFGAECAPELQHDIDPMGGDITALASMDDVVYVFKAGAIFAFNGDGPYEDGSTVQGNLIAGFSASQLITSDVGCTDPSSIVLTPKGLMFKSAKGIYIITRAREVDYIGRPVEAFNAQNVRRATVLPDRTAALFLTDSGESLYFDYEFTQWSTFTNHEGYDSAVVGNRYHYLRKNDDGVFRETPGEYTDAGARITLTFETAWLHLLEHLQGFQRFWKLLLLGTWSSPHQLGISYRLSYDEAWSEPYWLDATGEAEGAAGWITGDSANPIGEDPIVGSSYGDNDYGYGPYGGQGDDVYWWRYGIHENGASVQFRFEDFEKEGLAGASFELTEMTIVGGVKKVDMRPFSGARST